MSLKIVECSNFLHSCCLGSGAGACMLIKVTSLSSTCRNKTDEDNQGIANPHTGATPNGDVMAMVAINPRPQALPQ